MKANAVVPLGYIEETFELVINHAGQPLYRPQCVLRQTKP